MSRAPQSITVVQGLLIDRIDTRRVFMAHRPPDKLKPLMWEYPGGKVDPGEGLEEALIRELREELSIDVVLGARLRLHPEHDYIRFNAKDEITLYMYAVHGWAGEIQLNVATESRWVDPEDAVDHLPCLVGCYLSYPAVTRYLKEIRQ